MQKISVAIVGWGNVGRGCKRAIEESPDMVLTGIVRRSTSIKADLEELAGIRVVSDIKKLPQVDVVLLCVPSREVLEKVKEYHQMGYSTVDSYDEHHRIINVRREMDISAKTNRCVSMLGCGWDPGTDSSVRALMKVAGFTGLTTTTFGGKEGGRSMGHTVQAKAFKGVKNALALTLANGRGKQKRRVYIELEKGANIKDIEKELLQDSYFNADPTEVIAVESIDPYNTLHHSVEIERTGMQVNQKYTLEGNNPELTANIMTACARACVIAKQKGEYGAYTFIERPMTDYLAGATVEEKLEGY